ncbi:urea ABC transporter permease subunit UrtC [Micromonospora sp. PPF5-17]|uniref:Urea ABC transporter permease subunit UrtC n=1 Tax=Micromonospora solifontis TaxID=2487138 RepID=A0ABX9WFK4_9ACTN|nr:MULTISPECIES: urea ABC transporter permease subunit UrtC [Micromonospora]NES37535.1 urea ABC transporter permease subunit UrtC [Micromonospora solifontis]NES58243.1 urea ABC transporter permease subunit UrtC [Micromonospora sp. PPF5-6]RNL98251.1 urea ABC transporter permease subunit UrtC [Micromonospora solifontis]
MTAVTPAPPSTASAPAPADSAPPSRSGGRSRLRAAVGFAFGAALLFAVAPLALSDFRLALLAKYLCVAMVAVGIGIAWGRGGMLTLGQGVFFGLGGYAMAMHLKLADAGPGGMPDFMQLYGQLDELPVWWRPFASPWFALPATVLLPMAFAFGLGSLVFRRRVRGAYFAILSQALAAALVILLIGQQGTTGGTNGLTDIQGFFGYDLDDPVNQRTVYFIIAGVLLALLALARQLIHSRYGELLVAVRDSEERVRFLGYDPASVKLVAYVVAAGMAGLAGALFVPAVGIISPALIGIVPSIEFVIGVAVGGRATLLGPVLGAVAVAWARTALSERFPGTWTYLQGLLFVVVVAFLPGGLAALWALARRRDVGEEQSRRGWSALGRRRAERAEVPTA